MKILLTGASGFLGQILKKNWEDQHEVLTLGRNSTNTLKYDLSTQVPELPSCDLIIHAAGKAHVIPKSAQEENDFFQVNLVGTQNLLDGIVHLPKSLIFISSVSVYGKEKGELIDEDYLPKANTPYSKSKLEAERLVSDWGIHHQVPVLILRLPLVVGDNAPGNLGAMVKAIRGGYYRRIGAGNASKSMVLAEDLALNLPGWIGYSGIYNLTDGQNPTMTELDSYLAMKLGRKIKSLPRSFLKMLAKAGDIFSFIPFNSDRLAKLEYTLTFSDQKAKKELGWNPRSVVGNFSPSL